MKIIGGKVIVCSPGRNFVTLKLETEDGVYGLGDATLNGRELAVASYLTDHVLPLLVGRDARRIEDIWQFLYKGAYWRRGPVTMAAIAAVDTALWDIKGKTLEHAGVSAARRRLARGGDGLRARERRHDRRQPSRRPPATSRSGYKAVRAQCGVPRLETVYGVAAGGAYEPAERGPLPETVWSSERYLEMRARRSSSGSAASSAPTCICSTTCIIG